MNKITLAVILITAPATPTVAQQPAAEHSPHLTARAGTSTALTDGEVRRIDKDAKKITLRHGPIKNLDMPAMTMVFQVKDHALLDKVSAGDKVRFSAENISGAYVITTIEAAK